MFENFTYEDKLILAHGLHVLDNETRQMLARWKECNNEEMIQKERARLEKIKTLRVTITKEIR